MTETTVVQSFFEAYQRHDYPAKHAVLAIDTHFSDYAFNIRGEPVRTMWHWFCIAYGARKAPVEVSDVTITAAVAHEVRARYLFGRRQRPVDYSISSRFRVHDGEITEQVDSFGSVTEWGFASMAFGHSLACLSVTPWLQAIVRRKAFVPLTTFMGLHGYSAGRPA